MDTKRFRASPIGSLTPITGIDGRTGERYDHFAYLASPLGAAPELNSATWGRLMDASHSLGRLEQGATLVPNPGLLRRPTIQREAQSTSALEGTFAPLEEVMAAEVIDTRVRSSALNEVVNYIYAAENAFDWIESGRPITTGLMTDLHRTLVRGTAADTQQAGRVRDIQVVIGSRGGSVYDARFIPAPPGTALEAAFSDLLQWIRPNSAQEINPIVKAAMAHYQFETLHPFNDGNGRLGRLLIVLQLETAGLLSHGLLSVSPWFEQRRDEYQGLLAEVSASGDWNDWVSFFAAGIDESARDTASRLKELLEIQGRFHELIREAGARGVVHDIVDIIIGSPYVTIPMLVQATARTYPAVKTAVLKLVELGVLEERPSSNPRLYRAGEVVRVTSRPPSVN